jgi:hypothetical protein
MIELVFDIQPHPDTPFRRSRSRRPQIYYVAFLPDPLRRIAHHSSHLSHACRRFGVLVRGALSEYPFLRPETQAADYRGKVVVLDF